jgi:RNA polymerase sigma factor (TIGR02999 family)
MVHDSEHPPGPGPIAVPRSKEEILPEVYDELRRLAARYLSEERADHTLQATALVHEAWLRLSRTNLPVISDRHQFIRMAASAMRRILINHARDRGRLRRGGGQARRPLNTGCDPPAPAPGIDILALDEALDALAERDARKGRLVELRIFGGLELEEIAENLDLSLATVKRDWTIARAFLKSRIGRGETGGR